MAWDELAKIRAKILDTRDNALNDTNPTRTDYYLRYWDQHREVPWALLAHLVSRNAGYQMSDLARFASTNSFGPPVAFENTNLFNQYPLLSMVWALLETANFLIFRDVFPQLEAYRAAKKNPDHSDELFDMLADPLFDVDPFIVKEWKTFFAAAKATKWSNQFTSDWSAGTPIQRHSFALITNEQNQIEDRLVNDTEIPDRYLGQFEAFMGARAEAILFLGDLFEATYLCFPLATSSIDPSPSSLLLYRVTNFQQLTARIKTGRELYANLFLDTIRSKLIQTWALANRKHRGTRIDYNPVNYSVSFSTILPGGKKYSPPLVWSQDEEAVWYQHGPRAQLWYRHLYSTPVPLPLSVEGRTEKDPTVFDHNTFLAPLTVTGINQTVQSRPLTDLTEILF